MLGAAFAPNREGEALRDVSARLLQTRKAGIKTRVLRHRAPTLAVGRHISWERSNLPNRRRSSEVVVHQG